MDYFCFEPHDKSYQRFVDSKKSVVEKKYNDFLNLKEEVKSCQNIDKDTTLSISINKRERFAQSYIISPFTSQNFKNYIMSYFEMVPIDRIKNRLNESLNLIHCQDRDLNLNTGSRTGYTANQEKIHFHEWCSVINKNKYDETYSYLSADYYAKDDFSHFVGDIKLCFENCWLISLYFIDDLNEKYSRFSYSISVIGSKNQFINFDSEIKYISREDCFHKFLWKKGRHQQKEINVDFKEEFTVSKSNSHSLEEKEGWKNKKIFHQDFSEEIQTNWSKQDKRDYEKVVVSRYFDSEKREIKEITLKYVDERKTTYEHHYSNAKGSDFENRGMTKHEFINGNASNGTYYYHNNEKRIHEDWSRIGDEVKSSRTEQNKSQMIQKISGKRFLDQVTESSIMLRPMSLKIIMSRIWKTSPNLPIKEAGRALTEIIGKVVGTQTLRNKGQKTGEKIP